MIGPTLRVVRSRARLTELGRALINPSPTLSPAALMTDAAGATWYLPVYAGVVGRDAFASTLAPDGTLTLYLMAEPPTELAGRLGTASPVFDGTQFGLVLDASGDGASIPLAATREGGNLWRLSAQLAGAALARAQAALFDATPNVAVEITQTLTLAAPQTETFITRNWANDTLRAGLLDAFGGIPFDSAATFLAMIGEADPDYAHQFLVLAVSHRRRIPAPPLPGYVQWQVDWNGRAYNYYQDNQERARVFYLPDAFELARGPADAPAVSLLQFSLPEGEASVERTRATFRLFGRPVVDEGRIEHAARLLRGKLGLTPQMVSAQDAHGVKTSLTQYLPNAQASASKPALQAEAVIDLSAGVRNEVHLNFTQFRAIWSAIFSVAPENPLFRGWVDVEFLGGRYKDRLDFSGRLPKGLEAGFFDDILEVSTGTTHSIRFHVRTVLRAFAGPPEILEVEVMFPSGSAVLTASRLQGDITVERSIRDIIIGRQDTDTYPYRLRIVREDGSVTCCAGTARRDTPNLWLSVDQIKACTGLCA